MPFKITTAALALAVAVILATTVSTEIPWGVLISIFALYLVFLGVGSFFIQLNFFNRNFNNSSTPERKIALSFDDGPLPRTREILNFLEQKKAPATFFCIGRKINSHPSVFKEIVAKNHAIGHHSYSHSNFFPFFSRKRIIKEIEETDKLISEICGAKTGLFRPPFGVTNPTIAGATSQLKLKVIGWNLRSLDGTSGSKEKILKRVIPRIQPGSLILLHDTNPEIIEILGAIFDEIEKQKLKPVTVNEFFDFE